jgi:hypothetical protein
MELAFLFSSSSICSSFLKDDRNAFAIVRLSKLMEINIKLS